MRLWRGVSKSMFTCFLTEDRFYDYAVKLAAATFKRSIGTGSIFGGIDSHAWRSEATHKYVLAFYPTFSIRERYIVSVSSNFLTQISCGIKTKCRKTRAMQRDFTIVDSLALRQCDTSMIPDTHLLKLLFLARYTSRSIYQSFMCDSQSAWAC